MENKKEAGLFTWIIVLIACGVIFVMCLGDIKYILTGKADDVNDMISQGENLEVRDTVSIELEYVIDWYAELTEKGRRTGRKVTYHCLGVLDDGRLISISVKKDSKECKQIETLIEETYAYVSGETTIPPTPVKLSGTVRKIDSRISGYYHSSISMLGLTSDDYINLEIDVTQKRIYHILLFALSIILMVVSVICIMAEIKSEKEKKEKRIRELNSPVIKSENDPIFNDQFYNRLNTNNSSMEADDTSNDFDSLTDNSSKSEEGSTSKFSLKKD